MIFVIRLLDYEILVPFVCHKCGACCQRAPQIYQHELPNIADFLDIPLEELENLHRECYLTQNTNDSRDCLFLENGNICKIHPCKPDCCKSFVGENFDVGENFEKCPGRPEFLRIEEMIFKNARDGYAGRDSFDEFMRKFKQNPREVSAGEWPKLWEIFLSANPSPKMIQEFIGLNHIPEIIWKNYD